MEFEGNENEKETVVTQISIGGFDCYSTVDDLVEYLENKIGMVWRCRLKTSWTPPESFPEFKILDTGGIGRTDKYEKVEPHAFVHFASPDSATEACNLAGRCDLFYKDKLLKVSLGPRNPFRMNQRRRTTDPYKFCNVCVDIGTLVSQDEFFSGWLGDSRGINFLVDPFDGTCRICFQKDTAFRLKSTVEYAVIKCDYKLEFLVRDINKVKKYVDTSSMSLVLFLQLTSSPSVSYRTADDDIKDCPHDLLDDDDPWIRTTDFTPSRAIGRCSAYRISIPPRYGSKLQKAIDFFSKRLRKDQVEVAHPKMTLLKKIEPDFGVSVPDPLFYIHQEGIPFEIMFLVNAVMHKGIFNQYQLSDRFFYLLRTQENDLNAAALKHIYSYKSPVFDAYKRLKLIQEWLLKNPKSYKDTKQLDDITEVRRLVITPTKAYCLPPEAELSNRVLREYKDVADRFLRVTFMDEGMKVMNSSVLTYFVSPILKDISSKSFAQKTTVFKRVKSILTDGFDLCGRKYSFLAFSSNQLRDRSAWFFAEQKDLKVQTIRKWMGKFTNRNIAKCAARMGQCFSSTYATVKVPPIDVDYELPDIQRNGYVFSDGIGKITPDLAMEVAKALKLDVHQPCAYQIRYAGCKGVVACWPTSDDGFRLSLRPSMNKFQTDHNILEICSWTRYQPGFLNRQIITLLSTLNVPDEIFWEMQDRMLGQLNRMLMDSDVAFDVLTASCAEQGNEAAIMLSAGFNPQTELHLRGMLTCVRAAQLWGLREKSRIFVQAGRWLMGCLDELQVLEHGQCFVQVSSPSLEHCFLKHGSGFSETTKNLQVVTGLVAIAKNPCLHPGDVRILEAVDAPGLHHLYDCVVFPQKGDRPHTNEASGSDLDGDLYFVTWDEKLIPPSKRSWMPMDYAPPEAKELSRSVQPTDIIDFFAKNMVNENLGAICNAHVVHADLTDYKALDENCIKLAELAATAVDFPKTGKLVTMPQHLKPKLYPDFMGKEAYQSYKSNKILGRLYRQIVDSYNDDVSPTFSFVPDDILYDIDLEIQGSSDFLASAWDQKCSYDGQLKGLMGQYKVEREEEIVTGHVWSMPKYTSKKQGELKERLKHAYSALKKEFRKKFDMINPKFENLSDDQKNKIYEQKASAWYQVTYNPEWVMKSLEFQELDTGEKAVMLSFAWIAVDYLARIKVRHQGMRYIDSSRPINSLGKYLADRM